MAKDLLQLDLEAAHARTEVCFRRADLDSRVSHHVRQRVAVALDALAEAVMLHRLADQLRPHTLDRAT